MPLASRTLSLALLLCLAAAPAWAQLPVLAEVQGTVEIAEGDPPVWRLAQSGEQLLGGWAIRVGPASRAELDLGKGLVRLYENSLLRLPAGSVDASGTRGVELDEGGSLFDIDKSANHDGFQVKTPEAVVLVKGTRFSVAVAAGEAAVAVFRGLVSVRATALSLEHELLVRPGFTAVGGVQRPFELHFDRSPDPWSSWSGPRPGALPEPGLHEAAPSPAEIATQRAQDAASKEIRPAVVERALRDRPGLRETLREKLRERSGDKGSTAQPPAAPHRPHDTAPGLPDPKTMDPSQLDLGLDELHDQLLKLGGNSLELDPAVGSPDPHRKDAAHSRIAEHVLNHSSKAPTLRINVLKRGGPNRLEFIDPAGSAVATMTKGTIHQVIQNHDPTLIPAPVLMNIQAGGINPVGYIQMLHDIYF